MTSANEGAANTIENEHAHGFAMINASKKRKGIKSVNDVPLDTKVWAAEPERVA